MYLLVPLSRWTNPENLRRREVRGVGREAEYEGRRVMTRPMDGDGRDPADPLGGSSGV